MSERRIDPTVLNVASFLRDNKTLKQRQGRLQGNAVDFFRFKRATRALRSNEYRVKQENPKNNLPVVQSDDDAKALFIHLIKNQLVLPAQKLSTKKAKENHLAPKKGTPCFLPLQKAELTPDEYYLWFYKKKNPLEYLMGFGIVVAIFTLILFPLWPLFMRKGVWYLSMGCLGFLVLFFIIAIIRLIIFIITYFAISPGLWIFPNLFEDCGFIDSFKPLYEWNEPKSKKSKGLKSKKTIAQSPIEKIESSTPKITTTSSKPEQTTSIQRKGKVILEEIDE